MNTYLEHSFLFHTKISLEDNGMLFLEKKAFMSTYLEAIPLASFSPEPQVKRKKLPKIVSLLFNLELIATVSFFVSLIRYPEYLSSFNILWSILGIGFCIITSILYYIFKTRPKLHFNCHRGISAFNLPYRKTNLKQIVWIGLFKSAVLKAHIDLDRNNLDKLSKGIENLRKQGLISPVFAEELHQRLEILTDSSIR